MSLAACVRSVLKVLLRAFYVRDCSFLPEKDYIFSRDEKGQDSSAYPCYCTSLDGGTVKAQYGMRFMRLPFRDVASILLNKDLKEVTDADLESLGMQNQELELLEAGDPVPYVKNYYHYQNLFIDNYKLQKANGRINQETLAAITEEIAHNDLLNDTPSFVIINALSVYYRLCACYLAVRRKERKPVGSTDISIAKAMLNASFMRSAIFTNIYPIIEASYHYEDKDFDNVERNYNRQVITHCERFQSIKQKLLDKCVSEAWVATIMKTLQKTMLSIPFLYIITQKSGIDYHEFFGKFAGFDVRNAALMDEVEQKIALPSFSVEGLLKFINDQKRKRTTNSKLDTDFLRSLVYLATETQEGFVPKGLVSFVLTHKKCIHFGSVILWKKGLSVFKKKEEKLVGFPSLVSFGLRDERYFVDQQMAMFGKGRSFFMGLKGMEGTLTGKESKDKAEVESFNRLIVQSFFAKAVYAVGRNVAFDDFSSMFDICFDIRPIIKDVQGEIQGTILKEFYSKAGEIGYLLPDPVTDAVATSFQKRSEQLFDYTESLQEDLREKFYKFCDINYLHGF